MASLMVGGPAVSKNLIYLLVRKYVVVLIK